MSRILTIDSLDGIMLILLYCQADLTTMNSWFLDSIKIVQIIKKRSGDLLMDSFVVVYLDVMHA
jgi:hypothetical protein